MTFIIGLIIFAFLYVPLLLIVLAHKERKAKVKEKLRRQQNIEDMREALASAAEASGGCGYSGKRQP